MPNNLVISGRILFAVIIASICLGGALGQKPELITEEGHTSVVRTLAFSPNGKVIASGSEDKKIKLWDVDAGMEIRSMAGNGGTITSLVFADDRTVVSGDDYGIIKLWNITNGDELFTLEEPGCEPGQECLPALALSDDRKTLVVAGKGRAITFWDIPARKEINKLEAQGISVRSLAFTSTPGLLATAGRDGTILIWNIADRSKTTLYTSAQGAEVSSVDFSPDGKYLVGGSSDDHIRIWSIETRQSVNSWLAHSNGVNSVIYDRETNSIISGGNDNKIKIWNGNTGTETLPALEHKLKVRAVAASQVSSLLAGGGNDSSVTLWDGKDGREIKKWEPHTFSVTDVVLSPNGDLLATAHSPTIKLWNLSSGRELRTLKKLGGWIFSLSFSSDGSKLASCSFRENAPYDVNVWDVARGQETFHVTDPGAQSVALSAKGNLLASSSLYGTIKIWDLEKRAMIRRWQITSRLRTRSIAFDSNGFLVSGGDDGVVRVWNVNQDAPVKTIQPGTDGIRALDISADGTMLAVRGHSRLKILSMQTWQESAVNINVSNYEARIKFSPDGKRLAVGEYEFNGKNETVAPVRLWDVATGKLLKTMLGHKHGITAVGFSKDGNRIVSGSWDNTWKLWSVDTEKELCTIIALDESDWVAVTPEGRFDASTKGMELMHWRVGDELITLTQLKQRHWEPGLLSKLFLLNQDGFVTNTQTFHEVPLFPKIEYEPPAEGSTSLTIKLTGRNGGGIGRVQVKINNTEVYEDARAAGFDPSANEASIPIDFSNAPVVPGKPNTIQIITWNSEGYLSSRPETREWIPNGETDRSPQEFYAVVVGVSEYSNPDIKLKYTARDAEAMAGALELGARRLFPGPGRLPNQSRVHINLLRTTKDPTGVLPTKANIKAAFESMKTARTQDVFVVYLSGHALAVTGSSISQNSGLYCFLTSEALSRSPVDYSDPAVVEQRTITSRELAAWIRPIGALHRVMILDTCAAGAAAQDLGEKGDDISAYQLRAIDSLQERTGFFVLMGSAANSVSYEASKYGQSLLTYSLLRRMKVEQPFPESIEVAQLFQYAVNDVHQLALGNNGIQKPEVRVPEGGTSFPIGLLTNDDKKAIKAESPKPVILRPTLLSASGSDTLKLTAALRKLLDKVTYVSAGGSLFTADIVYVDADGLDGAYSPSGIYTVDGNQVKVDFVLTLDSKEIRFQVTGSRQNLDELMSKIMEEIYQRVEVPRS